MAFTPQPKPFSKPKQWLRINPKHPFKPRCDELDEMNENKIDDKSANCWKKKVSWMATRDEPKATHLFKLTLQQYPNNTKHVTSDNMTWKKMKMSLPEKKI